MYCWENVKNYYCAKFQADPGMFSYQNRRGLNRSILRPSWLMTSGAADVISVPSVITYPCPKVWCGFHQSFLVTEAPVERLHWNLLVMTNSFSTGNVFMWLQRSLCLRYTASSRMKTWILQMPGHLSPILLFNIVFPSETKWLYAWFLTEKYIATVTESPYITRMLPLKTESYHDVNVFVTVGTVGCRYDN